MSERISNGRLNALVHIQQPDDTGAVPCYPSDDEIESMAQEILDLRRKVKLLKEDAERLVSAIQHRGSFNEIMAENFGAVMNHKQVMREVDK